MGTIYVSDTKGGGDFKCDGVKDQVQINAAFDQQANSGETIYLEGGTTYVIDTPVLTSNRFTWTGGEGAVLKLANGVYWDKDVPMVKQRAVNVNSDVDITVEGFTIDGNYEGNKHRPRGKSYHTMMWFYYKKVKVSNMTLQNGHNDGLKVMYANAEFSNNKVYKLGHEAVFAIKCNSVLSEKNEVRTKTNSGTRVMDSNHIKILNNKIYTEFEEDAGGPGIQVQVSKGSACPAMNDVEISGNDIHDTYGPGIWLVAFAGSPYTREEVGGVWIHDNEICRCGTHRNYDWLAGIVTSGFYDTLIENNVFEGNYGAAVLAKNALGLKPNGSSGKYNTIIRDNEISGTIKMKCGIGGEAIRNEDKDSHTILSDSNYIWDNVSGPYYNVSSNSDILHAPDVVEKPAYVSLMTTDYELEKIRELYPKRTIFKRV